MPYFTITISRKRNSSSFHRNFINLRGLSVKAVGLLVKHIRSLSGVLPQGGWESSTPRPPNKLIDERRSSIL